MTRAPAALAASVALLAGACTDANLYSADAPPREPDRVTLTGRVCADDPVTSRYPLRVVLLVDQAAGPLFSDFDPAGARVAALSSFVQSARSAPNVALAVVGYAGRARKLAPAEGSFTRNPGELLGALAQLALPQPCTAPGQCRDYLEGLRSARAIIEADMATLDAGTRVLTQYVVIHVAAGLHEPLTTTAPDGGDCVSEGAYACQHLREATAVAALREAIGDRGGAGLRYHVIQLGAGTPEQDAALATGLQEMALAGRGLYQHVGTIAALSADVLDLLEVRTVLRAKHLVVANVHAAPTPDGPVVDSDADGLSDAEEATLGTSPGARDSDGDGIGDLIEVLAGLRPLEADAPSACEGYDPFADSDLDGLYDCDERIVGTDPSLIDSDGDGAPDRLEVGAGLDYLHPDAELDADGDGVTNGDELQRRSDPRSADATAHLAWGYRYDIDDEGVVEERFAAALDNLGGVEIVGLSSGTTAGLGALEWAPAQASLRWRDPGEGAFGPLVPLSEAVDGELLLPAASWAPLQGEQGRAVTVRLDPAAMPATGVIETVRVTLRARHCLTWTVRNVRLMPTIALDDDDDGRRGLNDVIIYFAQAPEGRIGIPGPFRLAAVPFRFVPPTTREPGDAVVEVFDAEFVRPRIVP